MRSKKEGGGLQISNLFSSSLSSLWIEASAVLRIYLSPNFVSLKDPVAIGKLLMLLLSRAKDLVQIFIHFNTNTTS